jgi:hypothetical protein
MNLHVILTPAAGVQLWSLEDSSLDNGENVSLGNLMREICASDGKQTSAIQAYNVIIIVTDLPGARKSL